MHGNVKTLLNQTAKAEIKMKNMDKIAEKMHKVMGEFKDKDLHSGKGGKIVKNRKQAIAIAMSEANKMKGK